MSRMVLGELETGLEENSATKSTGSHLDSTKESFSSNFNSSDESPRQASVYRNSLEILDVTDDLSPTGNFTNKFKGTVEDATTVNFSTVSSAYTLVHVESARRPFWRLPRDGSTFSCFLAGCLTIRNSHVALAVLCLCAMSQNITVGGANNAILSTIERAFFMTSMESALFLSVYDIANTISSPIIGTCCLLLLVCSASWQCVTSQLTLSLFVLLQVTLGTGSSSHGLSV